MATSDIGGKVWLSLHTAGAVRNSSEVALATYAKRQAGVKLVFAPTEDEA
jgi:hypothetical protein